MPQNNHPDVTGLRLPRQAVRVLKERGIYVPAAVTLEHQHLAQRYVVRGLESGGAAGDVGHYVTFAAPDGAPIESLHPVDSIAVNGIHAVVIAQRLVRIEMVRKSKTYELLITEHAPGKAESGGRPRMATRVLFRGSHGRIELDLMAKDKNQAGSVVPAFYSPSGESVAIPAHLVAAVRAATKAVNCSGCSHSHYVQPPQSHAHAAPVLAREVGPVQGSARPATPESTALGGKAEAVAS